MLTTWEAALLVSNAVGLSGTENGLFLSLLVGILIADVALRFVTGGGGTFILLLKARYGLVFSQLITFTVW